MDIRLIFRNRRRTVPDEAWDAKHVEVASCFRVGVWPRCVTRSCSSQAMERRRKVASAWRWLSTSKGAGSPVGKSAGHISSGLMVTTFSGKQGDPMLPRKSSSEVRAARTPNRHRWLGREYQGERVNHG